MKSYACKDCERKHIACDHHVEITHMGNLGRITFAGRASNAARVFTMLDTLNRAMDDASARRR